MESIVYGSENQFNKCPSQSQSFHDIDLQGIIKILEKKML